MDAGRRVWGLWVLLGVALGVVACGRTEHGEGERAGSQNATTTMNSASAGTGVAFSGEASGGAPGSSTGAPELGIDCGFDACQGELRDTTGSCVHYLPLPYCSKLENSFLLLVDCAEVPKSAQAPLGATSGQGGQAGGAGEWVARDNWVVDDSSDPGTVTLLGETCERVQAGAQVDFMFACIDCFW